MVASDVRGFRWSNALRCGLFVAIVAACCSPRAGGPSSSQDADTSDASASDGMAPDVSAPDAPSVPMKVRQSTA